MDKNIVLRLGILCSIIVTSADLFAEIKLPAIFGNNMVLQQQTDVAVWGTADKNSAVEVITSWNNKKYSTKAEEDGHWKLKVATPKAGGPYNLTISDGKVLTLENVLIGEVWVCSGQSNMTMPVKGNPNQPIIGSLDAIVSPPDPMMRFFTVKRELSIKPLDNFKGEWDTCDPESISEFSATAFYFGQILQKVLNVPVGLIHSSWGGTNIQAWMSEGNCKEFDFIKLVTDTTGLAHDNSTVKAIVNSFFNAKEFADFEGKVTKDDTNDTNTEKSKVEKSETEFIDLTHKVGKRKQLPDLKSGSRR